ncbi:MAG: hypothetical protein Q9220_000724 [cf. Caloplaca sp. 1 TL-2023]
MSAFSKIRVGLIGLNAPPKGTPTGTSWAASAHLPYLKASQKYKIVALQNSDADKAALAIKAFDLNPEEVKAYGTPEDIANDTNVDLVVSSIRVDRHGGSLIPSIKAGKDIYVEWPIESDYTTARELTDLVKAHDVKNVVGLQGRYSPIVRKVKQMIDDGEIGKVEGSTLVAKNRSGATIPSQIAYFIDKKVGGNPLTIGFGHIMECAMTVLGDISSHRSLLVNQHPTVDIVDPVTTEVVSSSQPNDVPNQIVFDAVMQSGAVLTLRINNSAIPTPGRNPPATGVKMPELDWRIFGTKGEIRITSHKSWALNVGADDLKIELWKVDEGTVVEVDIGEDELENLPLAARNVARLYEAFADSQKLEDGTKGKGYADFEEALRRHNLIEKMLHENGF